MTGRKTEKDKANESSAAYLAKVLKTPSGLATVLYRTSSAMVKAGFTEDQAMEITKHILGMIVAIGGIADDG